MELRFNNIFECCCNYVNRVRLEYNRELDKIILLPCCGSKPKIMEEPFAFDSEYFMNNYDECIKNGLI